MFACASDNGPPVSFLENTVEEQERASEEIDCALEKRANA